MEVNEIRVDRMGVQYLSEVYNEICEEYRRRLCKQWDLDIKQTWWIPTDRAGETLALNDCEFSIGMADVRLFVERNIPYEEFIKWWDYNVEATESDCIEVNAYTWFNGYRGEKGGVG